MDPMVMGMIAVQHTINVLLTAYSVVLEAHIITHHIIVVVVLCRRTFS